MGFPSSLPFPQASQAGSSDHDRLVEHGAVIEQLQAGQARIEVKMDRLTNWIIGVLISAVGGLIVSIFSMLRAKT
jgi:hypothetical protein